ncbi:MAG: hypothetical protein C4523_18350 [Myxococcales bacterium]|nr:MAG: hypothetical protein C4523_18350 [Myxococcales bacterium]
MKVVVALFDEEVSPRLDGCTGILVADDEIEAIIDLKQATCQQRLMEIVKQAPAMLLCGGVRRCDYFFLVHSGVQVLTGLSGSARTRLDEFRGGALRVDAPQIANQTKPGACRFRRRRQGG